MKRFLLLLTFFNVFAPTKGLSQNDLEAKAPTLQIGLDGLSFGKGTLDAQLIMEIIAEKQREIKLKAIQSMFLDKMEDAGGTLYSYADNVLRELIFEKDSKVRAKKIMENTINTVFVSSFLTYYLQIANKDVKNLSDLAIGCGLVTGQLDLTSISSIIKYNEDINEKLLSKKKLLHFISMLIDISSEVVRHNEKLRQLGIMQISYSNTYEAKNKYLLENNSLRIYANAIYNDMEKMLNSLTDYIGLLYFIVNEGSFRNNNLNRSNFLIASGALNYTPLIDKLNDIITELTQKSLADKDSTLIKEINNLTNMRTYIKKATNAVTNNKEILSDILYTLYAEFKPILINQSYRSFNYQYLLDDLDKVCVQLFGELKNTVLGKDEGSMNKIETFLLLASKLYQFDKANTISEYLKLIEDIIPIIPDEKVKNALSVIITFVKDYSIIEPKENGKDAISFNVESFLVKLENIKFDRLNRWRFHMTVGLNNAYFGKDSLKIDGQSVRNLSFVSEKIGVKYVIKDWDFWKTRNPGETYKIGNSYYKKKTSPKEPLISNLYLLGYGSGLLYNLVNAKTYKEFNMPLAGIGAGITFYNALEFNVSWGVPIFRDADFKKSFYNSFVNVGFDIKFSEYYNRLRERQKANQTAKRLAEAKK